MGQLCPEISWLSRDKNVLASALILGHICLMSIRDSLLKEIETAQKEMSLSDRAFSLRAGVHPKFMQRLRQGNVTLSSMEAAKKYVASLRRATVKEAGR